MRLQDAIRNLDPMVDEHWTADGLPRMDALVDITGDPMIKRAHVHDALPGFTRDAAVEAALDAPSAAEAPQAVASAALEPAAAVPSPPAAAVIPETLEELTALPGLEPGKSVLDLDRGSVLRSADLTEAALGEIGEKITETQARLAEVEAELKQLYAKNDILTRASERHDRNRPSGDRASAIKDYLAGQAAVREMRSKRAQTFIAAGTTAADVREALSLKSGLDAALSHRRSARGSHRPPVQPLRP